MSSGTGSGGGGFLFVNATGASASDRKASTLARAFVMRNARAAQPWPRRAKTPDIGGEPAPLSDVASLDEESPGSHSGGGARRGKVKNDMSRMEIIFQNEVSIARPRQYGWFACTRCGRRSRSSDHSQSRPTSVCAVCRSAQVKHSTQPGTPVAGKMDPFSSMAVELDAKTRVLLNYCQLVFFMPSCLQASPTGCMYH